jgi:hypothetical protein
MTELFLGKKVAACTPENTVFKLDTLDILMNVSKAWSQHNYT